MTAGSASKFRYVFGPVLSGRLGRSLGLDLLGARICSFDCLYCEAGRTEEKTARRAVYVTPEIILSELAAHKALDPSPVDAVTLGGLGEPCLNTGMAEIIAGAKEIYPGVPVALLTNSSLFWQEDVRREAAGADIVLPSLDSLVPGEFAVLNRPCPEITLDMVTDGLLLFRGQFSGRIFLEVLLADGINDSPENLGALTAFRDRLQPDRIDVVTLSRPGAYPRAKAAPRAVAHFREVLGSPDHPRPEGGHGPSGLLAAPTASSLHDAVTASLRRRPQTASQLAAALGRPEGDIEAVLAGLTGLGKVVKRPELGAIFYSLADD